MSKIRYTERPNLAHYGVSTAAEGLLEWDWAEERLSKARNYWVCTTRADGRPHASPVWGVWFDGALYFGCDRRSIKAKNLALRPDIVIHLESGDEVVILEGTISIADDASPLFRTIAEAYNQKYGINALEPNPGALVYVLQPAMAMGWLEHDYPKTATRWRWA